QALGERLPDLRPERGARLAGAALGDEPGCVHRLAVAADRRPGAVNVLVGQGRDGGDLRNPYGRRRPQEAEGVAIICDGSPRRGDEIAVGLVDEDQISELDDAALDALELIAAAGEQ